MKKNIKWRRKNILCLCILFIIILNLFGTSDAFAKVKLNKRKITIYIGNTVQLKMLGTKKKVKWSSNNKKIATVTKKGKIKGVKAGKAVITAKVGKKKYSCTVIIKNIAINKNSIEIKVGKKQTLKILGNKKKVKWYSDDSSIATVNKNGVVTALKQGVTIINAKIGKKFYCCVVVVKGNGISVVPNQNATDLPKSTESIEEISNTSNIKPTIQPIETNGSIPTIEPTCVEIPTLSETQTPTITEENPYLTKTVYVSKEENIGQINFVLPKNWTNQTKNVKSAYQAYSKKIEGEAITSGVLVGTWENAELKNENLEEFVRNEAEIEKKKMENAGWRDVSINISSLKMETGDAVVSCWRFSYNDKIQTMLVYNIIIDDYLIEVEIGDIQDNMEPNVYDVGRNIVNSLRVVR